MLQFIFSSGTVPWKQLRPRVTKGRVKCMLHLYPEMKKKHAKSYERVLGVRMLVERFVFFPFFPVATLRLSSANHQLQPCQEEKQNQRRTPNHPVARRHRWQMQMKIPQQVESKLIVLCCWKHLVAERTINWGVLSLCGHDNSWIREDSGPFKECTCEPICFFHSLQLEKQQT